MNKSTKYIQIQINNIKLLYVRFKFLMIYTNKLLNYLNIYFSLKFVKNV